MKVNLIHIRLSVLAGNSVPDITYKASCISADGSTIVGDFLEIDDVTIDQQSFNVSPMKPCRNKSIEPHPLKTSNLSETESRELLVKLKGQRYERELVIETYNKKKNLEMESSGTSSKIENKISFETRNAETSTSADANLKTGGTSASPYAGATYAGTYASVASNGRRKESAKHELKDDFEVSEIFRSSSVSSQTSSSRPGSASDHFLLRSSPRINSIPFFSGNPAVDITNGVVHLFKSNYKVHTGSDLPPPDTNTLCMLAVPASIDAHALCEFTAPYIEVITRMRVIRDRTPNQYMVLLTFATQFDAFQFYVNLNNLPFSSLLPDEVCHLVFVASVEALSSYGTADGHDEGFLPLSGSTELPDCMVCLERMDESVRGILTILCNHSFHAGCLRQWEDSCCPVCRYTQTPEAYTDNKCMICGRREDLWICLICGNVGCGRYTSEHAHSHYMDTHHNYAMALSDNRVWDYAGDYFVHRLFQNKEDGKLVKGDADDPDHKIEGIQLECMHLLTSQLESQRVFWEEKVTYAESRAIGEREQLSIELTSTVAQCQQLTNKVQSLESKNKSLKQKGEVLASKLNDALNNFANEQELNKGLAANQESWKRKVGALEARSSEQEAEIADLKEQLRDVMFYIEASRKIEAEDAAVRDDVRDGHVIVGQPSTSKRRSRGKKK